MPCLYPDFAAATQKDQFERLLPTFIQIIQLTEREETEYWDVVAAVFEGKPVGSDASTSSNEEKSSQSLNSALDTSINNKA